MSKILKMSFFVSGDWYQNKMAKKEEKMPGHLSGAKEILMLLLLGVAGQSFDSYSDMGLAYRFAKGTIYNGEFNKVNITWKGKKKPLEISSTDVAKAQTVWDLLVFK